MANDEHVALLKKGVAAWNKWRDENPHIDPDLSGADLSRADLRLAYLIEAHLDRANLIGADLSGARLQRAILVDTDLTGADLTGCRIYGLSAWGLKLERIKQQNLVITNVGEPTITVDNIEVAQFVYLLLHTRRFAMSSTPSERKACSSWAASLKAGWRSWNA